MTMLSVWLQFYRLKSVDMYDKKFARNIRWYIHIYVQLLHELKHICTVAIK